MKLMTYTTTLHNPTEILTQKVNVISERLGQELIAYWNRQATLHSPKFRYALVSFAPANHEEHGTFHSLTDYEKADRDKYDR